MAVRTERICERTMRIAIGCTQRGFHGKLEVVNFLRGLGHDVEDFGCDGASTMVDYCDLAQSLTSREHRGQRDIAILVDRDGAGMCIEANKFSGLRAAVAADEFIAASLRERYQCNVLCLGAEQHGPGELARIVASFLSATSAASRDASLVEEPIPLEAWRDAPIEIAEETIQEAIQG